MNTISLFDAIARIHISYFLAIESLQPWESVNPDGYLDGTLKVAVVCDTFRAQVRSLQRLGSAPTVHAHEANDAIELVRGEGEWMDGLDWVLLALGAKLSDVPGAVLLRLPAEEFSSRMGEIDAAQNLVRYLRNSGVPSEKIVGAVQTIAGESAKWHTMRCQILELGETRARADAMAKMERDLSYERFGIEALCHVELERDPRGSAFTLIAKASSKETRVPPLRLNWQAGTVRGDGPKHAARKPASKTTKGPRPVSVTRVSEQVIQVLKKALVTGNELRILEQLPPDLYRKVNDLLVSIGGKWHTGKSAHVFASDPSSVIADIVSTGTIRTAKDYEFFPTPAHLVERLLEDVHCQPGMLALEPHAGTASIALELANRLGGKDRVVVYELWERHVETLRQQGFSIECPVDFLAVQPQPVYDLVIMNPPFSGGRDVQHVTHAIQFVKPGGQLRAITSTSWRTNDTVGNLRFRALLASHGAMVEEIAAGEFREAGTSVPTLLIRLNKAATHVVAQPPSDCVPTGQVNAQAFDILAFM